MGEVISRKRQEESEEDVERLTIRVDNGLEEIYFYNPDDPEGEYTLSDIAKDGHDDICDQIANRLAVYEDTGLTPKQIEDIKKCLKRYDDDRIAAQQECGSVCEDAIEMHQQIKALTADKDEQAGRIMQLDSGLKKLRASLQWLKETIRDLDYKAWAEDNIGKIDALLGGIDG